MMRNQQTRRERAGRGFTLVEVLIGTVCFALIIAALNTAFYAAMRLRSTTQKSVDKAIPRYQAASLIKRDLQGIMVPGGILAGSFSTTNTGLGSTRFGQLQFQTSTGVLEDQEPWGDVQRVAYYIRQTDLNSGREGMDLIRATSRNLLPVLTNDFEEVTLLSGVDSIDFYFYDGSSWQTTWDATSTSTSTSSVSSTSTTSTNILPQAIKMIVQFALPEKADARQRSDPPLEIVVPIMVEARTNQLTTASSDSSGQSGQSGEGGGGSRP